MRIDPIKTPKEPTYQVVLDALAPTIFYLTFLITTEVPKIYMHQFWHIITKIKNSSSYKFNLDKKKCTIDVDVFRDILQICPRLPNQEFVVPPSNPEIVSFIKELGYTRDIDSVTKASTNCEGLYYNQNVDFVELLWEDFMFQIDNRDSKKQEKMYYPIFTKAIIQHFISKDKSISMRNRLFMHTVQDGSILRFLRFVSKTKEYQVYGALIPAGMTNRKMLNSTPYKTYLAFITGVATPKKARKFKKHASPSKKKDLVAIEEPAEKPIKKPAARRQSTSVQIKDTPGVSALNNKAPAKTERSKGIKLLMKRLPKEANKKQTFIKRVPQGDGDDDNDDDDQQSDDEQNVSDNPRTSDDEEETHEDEFVHTPENYVPTDDENVDDKEYGCINKEMYDDVNVELKDAETADEGKGDEGMIDVEKVDAENENVNQEVIGDQVNDDAQATATAALATQKTEVPLQSSSISSDYATKFLKFDNILSTNTEIISMMDIKVQHEDPSSQTSPLLIVPVSVITEFLAAPAITIPPPIPPFIPLPQQSTPIPTPTTTEATISTTSAPDSSTLTAIHQRLSDLENEVKTLRNVDHNSAIHAAIKSEVPTIVKEYLGTSLDDTLHKVIQRHTAELIKEHSVPAYIIEVPQ
ncbi:hypothetical protein Tco_0489875 [Tanacetum coccineum]